MKKKNLKSIEMIALAIALVVSMLQSCTIVRPGEVGFKQSLGKLKTKPLTEGLKLHGLFTAKIIKMNTRITDYSSTLHLPSKDGLEIAAEVTLLYHIKPESARDVYIKVGRDYEKKLVVVNFNAIAREVFVKFYARDLIAQKDSLEQDLSSHLTAILPSYGITIDQIIVRDITLPMEIVQAIKNKVTAEQTALQSAIDIERQRKELAFSLEKQKKEFDLEIEKQRTAADFSIDKQKKEAERTLIEAEAIKKANDIISQSLTDKILKLKSIDITKGLLTSPNAKLIITDGKTAVGIHPDTDIH